MRLLDNMLPDYEPETHENTENISGTRITGPQATSAFGPPEMFRVAPTAGAALDAGLLRDCEVATFLLHKLLRKSPEMTPAAAFNQVRLELSRICIFDWARMELGVCIKGS